MTVTIEEAQARLPELIDQLAPGEELIVTRDGRPVAKLTREAHPPSRQPRVPGSARGKLVILAEDDEHLKDFRQPA